MRIASQAAHLELLNGQRLSVLVLLVRQLVRNVGCPPGLCCRAASEPFQSVRQQTLKLETSRGEMSI